MKENLRFVRNLAIVIVIMLTPPILGQHSVTWEGEYIPTTNELSLFGKIYMWVWYIFMGYCVFEFLDRKE